MPRVVTTTGTGTTFAVTDPWPTWTSTSCTLITNPTWELWTATSNSTTTWESWNVSMGNQWPTTVSPEALQARREAQAREAEQRTLRQEAGRVADVRARELLDTLLSDEQKASMRNRGYFEVISSRGRRFFIDTERNSMSGNVRWMGEQGVMLGRFCCHPYGVPVADGWASQMLNLQLDEDNFLAVANLSSGRRPKDHLDGVVDLVRLVAPIAA